MSVSSEPKLVVAKYFKFQCDPGSIVGARDDFKQAIQIKVPDVGDELFRLYCEKVLIDFFNLVDVCSTMSRKIDERKYIIYHIASLFKFYETTFMTLNFDWVESHAHTAKMAKSSTNSGTVLVDAKAARNSDGLDVWHMEVAGPPSNATIGHTLDDTKKNPPNGHFESDNSATGLS
ncbi:hypothetical protein BC938DRAFT_476017 [Jimgerdemannia flammicorona]|uniref:Uncharacterized protein n=1 Tax=Jimgerdemannia flammicorona TaxID=994334 RepID=A0A433QZ78_9FUNG|nr:hypothetical protein BC938DRAFT_476017 [Jimgerdemannia flammicorona]